MAARWRMISLLILCCLLLRMVSMCRISWRSRNGRSKKGFRWDFDLLKNCACTTAQRKVQSKKWRLQIHKAIYRGGRRSLNRLMDLQPRGEPRHFLLWFRLGDALRWKKYLSESMFVWSRKKSSSFCWWMHFWVTDTWFGKRSPEYARRFKTIVESVESCIDSACVRLDVDQ